MHRIGVNVAISWYRGQSRRIRDAVSIEDVAFDLSAADGVMDAAGADLHALQQLISQLDEINRALILLYLEGYAQDEIAQMVGLSVSNVGTRILRIKQRLREQAAEVTA
jgi:RNA polymerase sigma-70 factor (ECF subfamily)